MATRVGILGLGGIGHRYGCAPSGEPLSHSEAYSQLDDVDVVLGIDPDAAARDDFLRRFPTTQVCSQPEEAPEDLSLDIVSICSPTAWHARGILTALTWRPRVILCEKPLALSPAEAEAAIRRCEALGCQLMTNYSRRWSPMLRVLSTQLGRLGQPRGACLRYTGGLQHNGTHWIDLLQALFGPIAWASGQRPRSAQVADAGESAQLGWENGLVASLIAVNDTGYSLGEGEVWGELGMIRFFDGGERVFFQGTRSSQWPGFSVLENQALVCEEGLRGHILQAVSEAVRIARGGGEPTCSGWDGLQVLKVVEAIRRNEPWIK